MKKKFLILGVIFALAGLAVQAQVYEMHYQGFEAGETTNYQVPSGSYVYDSVLMVSGSRSIRLLQSRTEDVEYVTDEIDFTGNTTLRYIALEFDHICNVTTNTGGNGINIGMIYVKRASQSDNDYIQLSGSEHYNMSGSYSPPFASISSFNKYSYDEWQESAMTNGSWKHERFDVNTILPATLPASERKLVFKFVLKSRTMAGDVPANVGWWIDNVRVRASQSLIVAPRIDMVVYPDGGAHPSSRGARIELDASTSVQQGINPDSVYLYYTVGSSEERHRVQMTPMGASPRHDDVSAMRFGCRIPFYGYDTLMRFFCVVKDATTNANEITFPQSANSWVSYWCVRGTAQAGVPTPQVLTGTSGSARFPFPSYVDNRSEWVYDSALLAEAGYKAGAITALKFTFGAAVQPQTRANFQIRMKNVGTDYSVSADNDAQAFMSDYMHVVWDSTLRFDAMDAGTELTLRLQDTFFYAGKDIVMQMIYDGNAASTGANIQMIPVVSSKMTKLYDGTDYDARPYVDDEFKLSSSLSDVRPAIVMTSRANVALEYDMGVAGFAFPNSVSPVVSQPTHVDVQLKNYGVRGTNGVRIGYEIDGGAQRGSYDWSGTLAGDGVVAVTVATGITLTPGFHTLRAWVEDSLTVGSGRVRDHEPGNDTAFVEFIVCAGPLNGVRHIGGSNADYDSMHEFLFNLASCGVDDSLVVKLAPGEYAPFTVPAISGVSDVHYVVFQPESDSVTFYADATTDSASIVNLDRASQVRFRNIRFVRRGGALSSMASLSAASDACRFEDCLFEDSLSNASSAMRIGAMVNVAGADGVRVERCTFVGGEVGVSLQGASAETRARNEVVADNLFRGQYNTAVSAQNITGLTIEHNEMYDVQSNTSYVMLAYGCNGDVRIMSNKVYTSHGAGAIALSDIAGTSSSHALVANNMIVCNDDGSSNILTTPFNILQGEWVDVVFNSVKHHAPSRNNIPAVAFGGGGIGNCRFMNNIVACYDESNYAFNYQPGSQTSNTVSRNVYYTEGSTLNRYGSQMCATLDAWRAAVPGDNTSAEFNPEYLNGGTVDLRTYNRRVKGFGTAVAGVANDLFGTVRHATAPCVGAFEFEVLRYDFMVDALMSPAADTCSMPAEVELAVRLRNNGVEGYVPGGAALLALSYQIGEEAAQTVTVAQAVPGDDTMTYRTGRMVRLPANGLWDSVYSIRVWVSYADDPNQTNDTALFRVVSRYHQPAAHDTTVSVPYASAATIVPTGGVSEWEVYGNASAAKKRSNLYWYYSVNDAVPFHKGDTLVTDILRQDTAFYLKQRRELPLVRLTQVQIKGNPAAGLTSPMPSWMGSSTPIAVQLTNIGDDTAWLSGDTLIMVSQAAATSKMAFGNIRLAPGKAIVVQFAAGNSTHPDRTVYTGENLTGSLSSNSAMGFIYKQGAAVVDALPMGAIRNNEKWTSQRVPEYVWSGAQMTSLSGLGGVYRVGFAGVAADWRTASAQSPMFIDTIRRSWLKYVDNGCPSDFARIAVSLQTHPTVDLSLESGSLPSGCHLGAERVAATIHNYGTQTATGVSLSYTAGGGTYRETLTQGIAPGADFTYTFNTPLNMAVARDSLFRVRIWANAVAGDSYQTNDTVGVEAWSRYTPSAPAIASTMSIPYGSNATIAGNPPAGMTMVWYDSVQRAVDTANTYVSEPLYENRRMGAAYMVADSNGGQIGRGTSRTASNAYPAPYQPYNSHAKQQYIYTASELRALGIEEGYITGVAFMLDSVWQASQTLTFGKYYLSMALTGDSVFAAATASDWVPTQLVYSRTPYTIEAGGAHRWVSHKLDVPFYWDGESNLVVQVAHENASAQTTGATTLYSVKSTSCLYASSNSASAMSPVLDYASSGRLSGNRPNIVVEQVRYGCTGPVSPVSISLIGTPDYDARISWPDGYDTVVYNSCGNVVMDVRLHNQGSRNISVVQLRYAVDGGTEATTSVTASVLAGDVAQVSLPGLPIAPGRHHIRVVVSLAGDEVPENDTVSRSFMVKFCGGTYTLSAAAGADFHTFGAALDTLAAVGIEGPVVFNVGAGTYAEQAVARSVDGTSPTNTITFHGEVREGATLTSPTSRDENYVLLVDGAAYLTFDSLKIEARPTGARPTFGNAVVVKDAHDVALHSNTFRVGGAVDDANASCLVLQGSVSNLELQGNWMDSGFYAVKSVVSGTSHSNLSIEGNKMTGFRAGGIDLQGVAGLRIHQNELRSSMTIINRSLVGVSLAQVTGAFSATKNQVYLVDDMNGGKQGMLLSQVKCTGSSYGTVVNNMVSVASSNASQISNPGGIIATDCEYLNLLYNSIRVSTGSSTASRGVMLTRTVGDTAHHIQVMNNVIANYSSYAYYVTHDGIVTSSDYNNYVSAAGSPLAYWEADRATLSDLQAANGRDGSSLSDDVYFVGENDLHLLMTNLTGRAQYNPDVPDDIDGTPRPQLPTPTIGAHQVNITSHNLTILSVPSPVMPVSIARPINIEGDSVLVKASFYNNGGSTESNVSWYAYLDGYQTQTRCADRQLGSIAPTQTKTDSVWLHAPYGVIDTQYVHVVLVAPTDEDLTDNEMRVPLYLAPAFNLSAVSIETDRTGCDLQQTHISVTLSNVGAKDVPAGFACEIGYSATAYYPSYVPTSPNDYRQAVSTLPGVVREQVTFSTPLLRGQSRTLTFTAPANLYPSDTSINLQVLLRGWCGLNYDVLHDNDSVWSDVIDSYYAPLPAVGHDTTFDYGTWGELEASQANYRPIQWYRDTNEDPFFAVNNYFNSCRWVNTPRYFHDSTYYLRSVSDLGCLSDFSELHVRVRAQQASDMGVATVMAPMGRRVYTENDTVRVRLTNYGTQTQRSFPVTYEVRNGNNVAPFQTVTQVCNASIAPNQSLDFKFDSLIHFSDATAGNNYYLRVWTDLAGDAVRRNDTIRWIERLRPTSPNNTLLDYPFVTLPESNYVIRANDPHTTTMDITRVSFNSIDVELPPLGRSFTNFGAFLNPECPVLHLTRGTVDTLAVTIANPESPQATGSGKVAVFIDFNRSGGFLDAGECVMPTADVTTNVPHKVAVTIPQTATPGYMKMRVVATNAEVGPEPAVAADNGHIMDFLLFIDPQAEPTDLALTQVVSPRNRLLRADSSVSVTIRMANKGSATVGQAQIFCSRYSVADDSLQVDTIPWSGSLAAGRSTLVTLPAAVLPYGTTKFRIWHSIAGDGNRSNDTLRYEYHRFRTYTLIYEDHFDAADVWYAPEGYNQYTKNLWQRGVPVKSRINGANTAPNAWATDLRTDVYTGLRGSVSYLYSPVINIAQIRADSIFFQMNGTLSNGSNLRLEYYRYDGTWQNVRWDSADTWYNSSDRSSFTGNMPGTGYTRYGFSTSSSHLNDDFHENLQFRFVYVTPQGNNAGSTYGEGCAVDDFMVGRARRRIDVGAVAITYPDSPRFGDTVYPMVAVKNYGLDTARSFQIGYTSPGSYLPMLTSVTAHIAPDDIDTFAFADPIIFTADYPDHFTLTAFTTLNEDIYIENDTIEQAFSLTPLANDIHAEELVHPNSTVVGGDSLTVTLRVRNFGYSGIPTATLSYIFNGTERYDEEVDFEELLGRPLETLEYFNYTFQHKVRAPMGVMDITAIAKCDSNRYESNDTVSKRIRGIASITDVAAASVIIDSSGFNTMQVQLVVENRGARGANNFEVGFWYDNNPANLHRETFSHDLPLPALTTATHPFSVTLPVRQVPYSQVVGFVHIENDNDPSNDTTTLLSTQFVDVEVLAVLVEENANPECRVFMQLRNVGNLAVVGRTLPLRAVVNGVELSANAMVSLEPDRVVSVEFPTTVPKSPVRRYVGSGTLQSFPMDVNLANNQTSVVRVVNYFERVPSVDGAVLVLGQNRPNPFRGITVVPFTVPTDGVVRLFVMDAMGKLVVSHDIYATAGDNAVELDLRGHPAGVYYYGVEAGGERRMRKLIMR